jgi:transposase, IS6 family
MNVDKNAAYPKAIADLKAAGMLAASVELKPGQILEYPDRTRSSVHQTAGQTGAGLLFGGERVANPCRGYEVLNMFRKGQMRGVEKGDIPGQVACIARLFGVVA